MPPGPWGPVLPAEWLVGEPQPVLRATLHLTLMAGTLPSKPATQNLSAVPHLPGAPAPSCAPSARAANSRQPPSTKVPWKESPPPADLHVEMTRKGKADSPRLPQRWRPAQRGPAVSPRCEVDSWLHPRRAETVICPKNLPRWPQEAQYLANIWV